MFNFDYHTDEVCSVKWNPNNSSIFASGSADTQIIIWDITQIGSPLSLDDFEDGPPELLVNFIFYNWYFNFFTKFY